MKILILVSASLLPALYAQEKTPAEVFRLFPSQTLGTNAWTVVSGQTEGEKLSRFMNPKQLRLLHAAPTIVVQGPDVCSVLLLEAHVDAFDPGIAIKPSGTAAAMPSANVPAPACTK